MGKKASTITLTPEERSYLELQTRSRTIQAQTVCRARILLLKADGEPIDVIADKVGLNRCSVMLCLKKFKEGGVENALFDAPGRGRNAEITEVYGLTAAEGDAAATGSRTLVVFYSRADENYPNEWLEVGHTKVMAGYIAEALGADTYEIAPVEAYPEGYDDCCDVASQEQKVDARPAIAGDLPDVSGYDVVSIGCPIWWGCEPMIVRTFLDGVDLSGKTIVPFTTHGGSGLGSVPANLQAAIPNAQFLDGLAVAGTSVDGARDEVTTWAKGLALA